MIEFVFTGSATECNTLFPTFCVVRGRVHVAHVSKNILNIIFVLFEWVVFYFCVWAFTLSHLIGP